MEHPDESTKNIRPFGRADWAALFLEGAMFLGWAWIAFLFWQDEILLSLPDGSIKYDPFLLPLLLLVLAFALRLLLFGDRRWWTAAVPLAIFHCMEDDLLAKRSPWFVPLAGVVLAAITAAWLLLAVVTGGFGLAWELEARPDSMRQEGATLHAPQVDFESPEIRIHAPWLRDLRSVWKGHLYVPESGEVTFQVVSDGHAWLRIDGEEIVRNDGYWQWQENGATVALAEGSHTLELEYWDSWENSGISLRWVRMAEVPEGEMAVPEPIPPAYLSREPLSGAGFFWRGVLIWLQRIAAGATLIAAALFLTAVGKRPRMQALVESGRGRVLLVALLTLGGAILRLVVLLQTDGMMLADEAIVGIASLQITEGHWPLLYYGQPYGGLFESYLAAPLFLVFGASNLTLKMVPFFLGVALIPLVYLLAARVFCPLAGLLAAAYIALPPVMCTIYSLMMMVGPIEIPVFGCLVLLLVLRLGEPGFPFLRECLGYLFLGALVGFAFWINGQILYYAAPAALYLLIRRGWTVFKGPAWMGVLGTVLGMAPLLIHNAAHDWETFRFLFGDEGAERFLVVGVWNSLRSILLNRCLPALLGGSVRWDLEENLPVSPLPSLVYLIAIAAGLWLLVEAHRHWRGEAGERLRPVHLLLFFCLLLPLIFTRSKFGYYSEGATGMPRYLFAAFPIFACVFGGFLSTIRREAVLPAALVASTVLGLHLLGHTRTDSLTYFQPVHFLNRGIVLPTENTALLADLEADGLDRVYADYWVGTQMVVESGGAIVVDTERDRLPLYAELVHAATRPVYLFHTNDARARRLEGTFDFLGWERREYAPYVVYVSPGDFPPKSQWQATTQLDIEYPLNAIDGDIHPGAIFISHETTRPGLYLRLDLGEVVPTEGVFLYREDAPPELYRDRPPGPARVYVSSTGTEPDDFRYLGDLGIHEPTGCPYYAFPEELPVRYVHIEITDYEPERHWSVYEVFLW